MTTHSAETKALWDAFDPAMQIKPRPVYRTIPDFVVTTHDPLPDVCPACDEGFIGRDDRCSVCGYW